MNAAASNTPREAAPGAIVRHCLAVGGAAERRVPAQLRLAAALGPDLAKRLVASLTATGRR